MKKSKLLIPALSIASVGAVVAPMVTSCSTVANSYSYQYYKDGTAAKAYEVKTAAKTAGDPFEEGEDDPVSPATLAYFKDVKANPSILADDILVAVNSLLTHSSSEYTNFTFGVSNISFGSIRFAGEDVNLLSMSAYIDLEKTVNGDTQKENMSITVNNCVPSLGFSAQHDKPAIFFNLGSSVALSALVNPSAAFSYKCVDKNNNVLYDIYSEANDVANFTILFAALEATKENFDDSMNALITILMNTSYGTNALPSAYFANQTEKSE